MDALARAFQPVGLGPAIRPPPSALRSLRSLLSKILPCVPCVPWANPPPSVFRPDMGWKAHATWHGLSSPWVWDGPYAPPSAVRPPSSVRCHPTSAPFAPLRGQSSVSRPPPSPFPPVKNPSVCSVYSVGQPSVLRTPPSVVRTPQTVVCMKHSCVSLRQKAASKNAGRTKVQCTVRAEKEPANIG